VKFHSQCPPSLLLLCDFELQITLPIGRTLAILILKAHRCGSALTSGHSMGESRENLKSMCAINIPVLVLVDLLLIQFISVSDRLTFVVCGSAANSMDFSVNLKMSF